IAATAPKPASSQVRVARCKGLVHTWAKVIPRNRSASRRALRSPRLVSGRSVRPVCWPESVHAVSPCRARYTMGSTSLIGSLLSSSQDGLAHNQPPPACHHAGAPHHCKSRVNAVAGIASTDADEIGNPTKSPVPADERTQPVAIHDLIPVKMSPVGPVSPAPLAPHAHVQIIGNADEPKLQGIQSQALRHDLVPKTHERRLDLCTSAPLAHRKSQSCQ